MALALPCFSSCVRTESGTDAENDKIIIVGTVFPHFEFARVVGGERCEVQMLMPPGSDSHSYSGDTPADILKIARSNLFIYTGGESDEKWVGDVMRRIEKSGKAPLTLSLCDICPTFAESGEGIIEAEDEPGEADEHVWTSPKNAALIVNAIRDTLCGIDPDGSDYYTSNAEEYTKKLEKLDSEFAAIAESTECKTLVFADRFPFLYFAKEYGFGCCAAFQGCASQTEPSPTTIVQLCDIINRNGLHCVFYTETSQSSVPKVISKATGAEPIMLHSCHTVTEKQLKNGVSYLGLMEENLEKLKEALCNE